MSTAAAMSVKAELHDLTRQIKNLAKKRKRALASTACAHRVTQRCNPKSPKSLMVFVLAGHSTTVPVDFILGRGWRGGKNRWSLSASSLHAAEAATEVEQAFLDAPSSALVALVEDPLKHFEFDDLLCAHQYVMEHRLYCWICNQNNDHRVAPSRTSSNDTF